MWQRISFACPAGSAALLGLLLAVCLLAGCQGPRLMPTPNVYMQSQSNPFADVAPPLRTNTVDVLYATDRQPIPQDDGTLAYGYGRDINRLAEQPAFYNTLTTNCTTAILFHSRASGGIARYNWKVLLSGYAPAYAYEIGRLDSRLPFAELKQLSHINARAHASGDAPDFSQRIRAGLPMPPPDSR